MGPVAPATPVAPVAPFKPVAPVAPVSPPEPVAPDAFVKVTLPFTSLEILDDPKYMVLPPTYNDLNDNPVDPRSYALFAVGIK